MGGLSSEGACGSLTEQRPHLEHSCGGSHGRELARRGSCDDTTAALGGWEWTPVHPASEHGLFQRAVPSGKACERRGRHVTGEAGM